MSDAMRVHLEALQSAMGVKFRDMSAVESAMRGVVSCCGDDDSEEMETENDGEEEQGKGPRKGLLIGALLSGKK